MLAHGGTLDCRLVNSRASDCWRNLRLLSLAIRRTALPPKRPTSGAILVGLARGEIRDIFGGRIPPDWLTLPREWR